MYVSKSSIPALANSKKFSADKRSAELMCEIKMVGEAQLDCSLAVCLLMTRQSQQRKQ